MIVPIPTPPSQKSKALAVRSLATPRAHFRVNKIRRPIANHDRQAQIRGKVMAEEVVFYSHLQSFHVVVRNIACKK